LSWDRIRHLHTHPQIVAAWRRLFGPALRWLTPIRRRRILAAAALIVVLKIAFEAAHDAAGEFAFAVTPVTAVLAAVLLSAYALAAYRAARSFSALPPFVRHRPLVVLHAGFWVLLVVLWNAEGASPVARAVLATSAAAFPFLLWRLSYMLQTAQRGRMQGTTLADHALYVWPVWDGSNYPQGKGFDYLSSVEAKDEEALARSQLAALKLFVLAFVFAVAHRAVHALVFGGNNAVSRLTDDASLGIPTVNALLQSEPATHAVWTAWLAIYLDLVWRVLKLAAFGHAVVGIIRFCGFNVFRNTYKPLLAETIISFWNRYDYYFKELLMNLFFFPTFVRRFRDSPRLRLFAAVFASAFLGNLYYHTIQDESLAPADWDGLAAVLVPRASYCFLLALGIYLSMLRQQLNPTAAGDRPWLRRALAIFGVWTFFGFIRLWHHGDATLTDRARHVLALAGIE
jgi:hypothetical protein